MSNIHHPYGTHQMNLQSLGADRITEAGGAASIENRQQYDVQF